MNEINDELMTPGCPQCAIKHLSAALYHAAKGVLEKDVSPDEYMTCVCTAYINIVEVRAGYHSHLWYAVGALVRAEEHFAVGLGGCVAREARLMLERYGEGALIDALRCIREGTAPSHADWAAAHFDEARRELPAEEGEMRMGDLAGSIEYLWKKYLEAPVASPEDVGKGGESDMATKKAPPAFLAKGKDAKGAKAACKGGKAKKAACKGGKCKK